MQRTVKFHVKIPPVEIASPLATENVIDENAILKFPFRRGNIEGTISLSLDPHEYHWGEIPDPDEPDKDDQWIEIADNCGGIIVCVNGQSDSDFEPKEFLEIARKLAIEYMSKFTTYLAVQLDQYWIHLGRMPEWKLWQFVRETEAKWINEDNESSVLEELQRELLGRPIIPVISETVDFHCRAIPLDEKGWNAFYLYLSDDRFSPDLVKLLMSNAKRYFDNGDYQMATVHAVTALDVKVEPFVEQRCKARNISGEKFKETKRFIAEYLKVLLPLVLRENEIDEWIDKKFAYSSNADEWTSEAILEGCIALNKIRNNVAHKGKFEPTDVPKVGKGIRAAELLLEFMEESANLTGEMEIGA